MLLITDGDIREAERVAKLARKSGQRIYAIGVGYAPAQSPLKMLAQESGGAREFVTPKENMAQAIKKIFRKMRTNAARGAEADWGQKPIWQSALPYAAYPEETIHLFALLEREPETAPRLVWNAGGIQFIEFAAPLEKSHDEGLLRIAGRERMLQAADEKKMLALALKYQLVSLVTNLVLVAEREDKIKGEVHLQNVPQMTVFGHVNVSSQALSA